MHITLNRNFATLFKNNTAALNASVNALSKLGNVKAAADGVPTASRLQYFERKVPGAQGNGFVIVLSNAKREDIGYLVV